MSKVSAPSVQRNQEPIKKVLLEYIYDGGEVLEIGSGSGEHAVYFADNIPDIYWTTSDQKENHENIKAHINESNLKNIEGPHTYKVGVDQFPEGDFDYVFTSNTLHIMSWKDVKSLVKQMGKSLQEGTLVLIYGPFNYNNEFTSESNAKFDLWLKERNQQSGIRNFNDLKIVMEKSHLHFMADHQMPANNRLLVFSKIVKA